MAATALSNAGAKSLSSSDVNEDTKRMSIRLHSAVGNWRAKTAEPMPDDFAIAVPFVPCRLCNEMTPLFIHPEKMPTVTAQKICGTLDFLR
jgi:hypothetical protein